MIFEHLLLVLKELGITKEVNCFIKMLCQELIGVLLLEDLPELPGVPHLNKLLHQVTIASGGAGLDTQNALRALLGPFPVGFGG